MIIKTNRRDEKGRDIYEHAITGESGLLNEITNHASVRSFIRHGQSVNNKVRTNRKRTLGRRVYFQSVNEIIGTRDIVKIKKDENGRAVTFKKKVNIVAATGKVIKHVQETPNALKRKTALFNFSERLLTQKSKWHKAHPEYQKKVS